MDKAGICPRQMDLKPLVAFSNDCGITVSGGVNSI